MHLRLTSLLFASGITLLLLPTFSIAQPFPPPQGWEYVRSFDSVNVNLVHVRADTASLVISDLRQQRLFLYWSPDGGATWDSTRLTTNLYGPFGVFPRSNTMWFWALEGSWSLLTTSDGGKTFVHHPVDSNTGFYYAPEMRDMFVNPFDLNDLVVVTKSGSGTEEFDAVYRSRDGGQTWPKQPIMSGQYQIDVLFDQRQQGLWYVNKQGVTYRTNDNGNNFTPIGNSWGTYCGISAPGVFRNWWSIGSELAITGVIDTKAEPTPSDTVIKANWLSKMDSFLVENNKPGGHFHALSKENFSYGELSPQISCITNVHDRWNPTTDSVYQWQSFIFSTTNDGNTWNPLWTEQHSAGFPAIDESTQHIWAISQDVVVTNFSVIAPPQYSLWKRDVSTNVIRNEFTDLPKTVGILSGFPAPMKKMMTLQYEIHKSGHTVISVCDFLGHAVEKIFDADEESGHHEITYVPPQDFVSGAYWLKLESKGSISVLPIVILK